MEGISVRQAREEGCTRISGRPDVQHPVTPSRPSRSDLLSWWLPPLQNLRPQALRYPQSQCTRPPASSCALSDSVPVFRQKVHSRLLLLPRREGYTQSDE